MNVKTITCWRFLCFIHTFQRCSIDRQMRSIVVQKTFSVEVSTRPDLIQKKKKQHGPAPSTPIKSTLFCYYYMFQIACSKISRQRSSAKAPPAGSFVMVFACSRGRLGWSAILSFAIKHPRNTANDS